MWEDVSEASDDGLQDLNVQGSEDEAAEDGEEWDIVSISLSATIHHLMFALHRTGLQLPT